MTQKRILGSGISNSTVTRRLLKFKPDGKLPDGKLPDGKLPSGFTIGNRGLEPIEVPN